MAQASSAARMGHSSPAGQACSSRRGWGCSAQRESRRLRAPMGRVCATQGDPYRLLQVERGSTRAEIRASYIEQIRQLHPDVNPGTDTTAAAAALNAAYEAVLAALERGEGLDGAQQADRLDVFDRPEAPPTEVFVNPFACYNVNPLMWEELQQAVSGAADPEAALAQAGAAFDPGMAVVYLSPEQLRLVREELERMSAAMDTISVEVTAFFLRDCLLRARVANNRMETSATGAW